MDTMYLKVTVLGLVMDEHPDITYREFSRISNAIIEHLGAERYTCRQISDKIINYYEQVRLLSRS